MAGGIERNVVESIKSRLSIVEVIGEFVPLKPRGKEHVGMCPFHDDHKPSLMVNPKKQMFKCFACGMGGDVFKFIQMRENLTFPEAAQKLADKAGVALHFSEEDRIRHTKTEKLYRVLEKAASVYEKTLWENPSVQDYLKGRGVEESTSREFGLGYAPDSWDFLRDHLRDDVGILVEAGLIGEGRRYYDRFRNRLMFPIRNALGRIVGLAGRTLGDDPAKYLNTPKTPIFDKSSLLYALSVSAKTINDTGEVVVMEGYLDAILAHQHGFGNAVATCGTAFTRQQAEIMKNRFNNARVILCFDGDERGQEAAFRATKRLLGRGNTSVCLLKDEKDPADILVDGGRTEL